MPKTSDQTTGAPSWKISGIAALKARRLVSGTRPLGQHGIAGDEATSLSGRHSRSLPLARLSFAMLLATSISLRAAQTNSTSISAEPGRPTVPAFQVQHYEVIGSSALSQETVDQVMNDARGSSVSLAQIRRALLKLQQAFRDRGFTRVQITLPQQPLTNGIVHIRVMEGSPSAGTESQSARLPAWAVPAYDVRHFEIYGNTVLTPEEIDAILGPAAGPDANLKQLQQALSRLQDTYRKRGLSQASVTSPQQVLTDGTVIVQITEGVSPEAEVVAKAGQGAAPAPPTNSVPARAFEVRRYEVTGNTLLRPETITSLFSQATGTNVTFPQIQKALGDLQLAYRERGFASASVFLPPQQLTNATVKVQVTEGRLVDARITGNHYFSSNNVMRALPSLQEALVWKDEVVNSRVLQREVDVANQIRDRQIYPVIGPGPDPGTSAIELRVKDRLPLHGRIEVNNQSTPGTPDWRVNASANYNNLWQVEHSIGVFYGFTPEQFKSGGLTEDYFLNRPLIANYGAYYRIPFGSAQSVQDLINTSAGLGYDEATHQFRLPSAGARPDLTVYASASSSDTGVKLGPAIPQTSPTNNPAITSQDSGQNLTLNESAGFRFNVPWVVSDTKRFNFSGGLDWKQVELDSYNTNNFTFIYKFHDPTLGDYEIASTSSSAQPTRHDKTQYLPLALAADYSENDQHGSTSLSLSGNYNFVGDLTTHYDWNSTNPVPPVYLPRTIQMNYGKGNFAFSRDQSLSKGWSLLLRASGQAATGPLISDEQFALGGVNSVRGYYEADERGDDGWFGSGELRAPFITATVPVGAAFVPVWVRGSVFMDGGQCFLLNDIAGLDRSRALWGTGFALSANINNHVDMRITLGWPLLDSANTQAGNLRAYFSLGGQF
jgi:hemolysin activation/secretion protein